MRRALIVLLVWSTAMVAGASPAQACSCAMTDPVDRLRDADAAFVGTLTRKDGPATAGGLVSSAQLVAYHFEVERALKGDIGSAVTVHAALDGASCGLEFHGSPRTGVLLSDDGGRWRSSLCAQYDPDALLAAAATLPTPAGSGGGSGSEAGTEAGTDAEIHLGSVALVLALVASLAIVARRSVRRSG